MENRYQGIMRFLALAVAVGATACSKVNFSPGTEQNKNEVPTAPEEEQFTFNDVSGKGQVDILFVDDNSVSMLDKQQKLSTRLASFVGSLGNVDWQIAITTTDTTDGPFGLKGDFLTMFGTGTKILNASVPNYEEVFKNTVVRTEMVNCGTICPSGDERPLGAVVATVAKRAGSTKAFFRKNADFVVVFLSDEDEVYAFDGNPVQPQQLITAVTTAFPNKLFTAYGIITKPGDVVCHDQVSPAQGKYGEYMAELIRLTGGVAGSICDDDYSSSLEQIGKRVRENSGTITLRALPIPETLTLSMDPFDPELRWELVGRSIKLSKVPRKGTKIVIRYTKL